MATGGTPAGHSKGYERGKSNNFVQFATLPLVVEGYKEGMRGQRNAGKESNAPPAHQTTRKPDFQKTWCRKILFLTQQKSE